MAPTLTIRNVTNTPLVLKLVEKYHAPEASLENRGSNILANVTSTLGIQPSAAPSRPSLAANAQSFERAETDCRIEPFQTTHTEVAASARGPQEILRLTLEADDQRYRIDVPTSKAASSIFIPLDQSPRHEFTGVFQEEDTYLAIYSSADLHAWMRSLRDEIPLSALSIPGTHNSPTCHKAPPSVRCQARSPTDQLENGVRFFDIRVQPESRGNAEMALVHSVFPICLTGRKYFGDLVKTIFDFLDRNPSETLIMSVKREGTGNATDQDLAHILHEHYTSGDNERRWYTDSNIPSLGQSRGKIVLLRRFGIDDDLGRLHDGRGFGIDASSWADNTPCSQAGNICVQDFYEVLETTNIDKKIEYARAHLERSGDCIAPIPGVSTDFVNPVPPHPFYINFLTASNFWRPGCWPEKIAEKLNPSVTKWLCQNHTQSGQGDGSTGIVVTDWVGEHDDWDIVRCIVGFNSKLLLRS